MLRSSFAVVAVAPVVLAASLLGWLAPLDHSLAELRFRLTPREPSGDIVLVDIDAKSIAAVGHWPWPRRIHADLVDALDRLGASEIAFDVDFSARSNPQDDAAFAAALERAGGLVVLAALDQASTARVGDTTLVHNRPIADFAEHAWVAGLNVEADADGIVRRLGFANLSNGEVLPSLAAMLGGRSGTLGRDFIVDFGIRADRIDRISVIDVTGGRVEPGRIAGKKVIVGASATELRDFFNVPVYGAISGSLLQAVGAESIAQGRALTPTGPLVSALGIGAISLVFLLGLRRMRWTLSLGCLAALSLAVELAALSVQNAMPVLPATGALQATLFAFALATLLREIDFRRILILIARNQRRNTQTVLDRVVEDNFAGVIVAGEDGSIRAASRSAAEILEAGCDLVGRKAAAFLPPELCDAMRAAIDAAKRGERHVGEHRELEHRRRNGQTATLEYVVTPSRLAGGMTHAGRQRPDWYVATLTFVDVTEKRRAETRIGYLARFDSLTGLPNRNQLLEALDAALHRKRTTGDACAVICFDIDRFETLNDTLGHDIGDLVLKAVAGRARRLLAPGDLVARVGGDDYAIVCAGGDAETRASALAESLAANVGEPYDLGGRRQVIGLSVGIALAEDGDADPLALLQRADTALFAAKSAGGNAIARFDPKMAERLRQRQILESDLWEALERGDFEIHYQPQVDLADRRLTGFEALLRWRHPRLGFVSPAEFIPIAEASGLIQRLGAWVMEEACASAAGWPLPLKVAVNVSAMQLARDDFARIVARALARSGLPPGRLEVEITESALVQENNLVRAALDELCSMGVALALDDFGTGYSSLNYIHKFPFGRIKIDRSFIAEICASPPAVAIVRAVAALARSLDIRLTAEGIERPEQIELLRLLGCEEGQGYLFGKPQPAETILRLMAPENAAALADQLRPATASA